MAGRGIDKLEIAVAEFIKGMYIERRPGFTWQAALRLAGYTPQYAKAHCSEIRKRAQPRIDKAKEELYRDQKMNLQDWENELQLFKEECRRKEDRTNLKGAIDMGIKLNQGYIVVTMDVTKETPIPEDELSLIETTAKELTVRLAKNTA